MALLFMACVQQIGLLLSVIQSFYELFHSYYIPIYCLYFVSCSDESFYYFIEYKAFYKYMQQKC